MSAKFHSLSTKGGVKMSIKKWLPNVVTLLLAALLVITQHVWANPIAERLTSTATASSKTTINYQGYLTDSSGNPVNDTLDMVFRLYSVESGGSHLWTETQSVEVQDGLFSVLLGSVEPLSQSLFVQNDNLWLGIAVGADEMTPREKLASAPYALAGGLPSGVIVMWSGQVSAIPEGWSLCDGTSGTPDLRDKFIVGAGNSYSVGATGGAASVTLSVAQMPSHSHSASASNDGGFEHSAGDRHGSDRPEGPLFYGMGTIYYEGNKELGDHSHAITVENTGGGQPHENRPPYYSLAFICKE
jgi:microcystin-dependent protein